MRIVKSFQSCRLSETNPGDLLHFEHDAPLVTGIAFQDDKGPGIVVLDLPKSNPSLFTQMDPDTSVINYGNDWYLDCVHPTTQYLEHRNRPGALIISGASTYICLRRGSRYKEDCLFSLSNWSTVNRSDIVEPAIAIIQWQIWVDAFSDGVTPHKRPIYKFSAPEPSKQ